MAIEVPAELRPTGSVQSAPPRRPASVRRTVTMDFTWPDGMAGDTVLDGRARDLITAADGSGTARATAALTLVAGPQRLISHLSSDPALPGLDSLTGESAMAGFRRRLAGVPAAAGATGTPLYQLLDDIPGATLVSGAAWPMWHGREHYLALRPDAALPVMAGICIGFQPGSSALRPDGTPRWEQRNWPAVDIDAVDDDLAWHRHPRPAGVTMRRARRIDVWLDGDVIAIDAFFQDSCAVSGGGRQSLHEYTLTAQADPATGAVRTLTPVARALPHNECPLAVGEVQALAGVPLGQLRGAVPERLRGTLGCTHLNDMLRALADVTVLAGPLLAARA
jgi:hypothetical protein